MRKERIKVRRGSFLNISEKHVTMFSDLVWVFTRGGDCQGRRAELPENPNEEWERRTGGVSHRV